MLDIGGLELLVIAVVLIVVVGPKDLPRMLRTFGRVTGQMRRMAGDFRRQLDDALKEAELDELRKTAQDVRDLDPRKDVKAAMNPLRAVGDEIRSSLKAAAQAPEPKVPSADEGAVPATSPTPRPMSSNPAAVPATPANDEPGLKSDGASPTTGASPPSKSAGGIS